jgi:hypothetical protein
MEKIEGPKKIILNIVAIIGAILFWILIGYGAYKGIPHMFKERAAPDDDKPQHDYLLRRSVGSDRTNWAPGGGR